MKKSVNRISQLWLLVCLCCISMLWVCCNTPKTSLENDFDAIKARGELRVLTLMGSTSYFYYKGEARGYEYEVVKQFADDNGLSLKVIVAANEGMLTQMLQDTVADLIAYDVPIIGNSREQLLYCGPEKICEQVLVQRNDNPVADVVELVGKDVYVEKGSKYEQRLIRLNNELGGGINICVFENDSVVTEDLIDMVADGKIDYTLADANLARMGRTYYSNLDIYVKVSFAQRMQWAVRNDCKYLAQAVDEWMAQPHVIKTIEEIGNRYFEKSKKMSESSIMSVAEGRISPFDEIFKREAKTIDWDWRLLAAMAYHESRFDTTVVSWRGAKGIMQLMPATAAAFGLSADSIANTDSNVKVAVATLQAIQRSLVSVRESEEEVKFMLAAYNAGIGHVLDAISLAKKYGKNEQIWYGEVEEAMYMKSNPQYYNDEVCRLGYFRGRQTTTYVRDVMALYRYYCEKIAL